MPCRSRPKRLFFPVIGSSFSSNASSSCDPGRSVSSAGPCLAPYHNMSDHVKIPSTAALFPRLLGEFDKRGTRRRGGQHRHREVEPGSLALALQIGPFRIPPAHPPIAPPTPHLAPPASAHP